MRSTGAAGVAASSRPAAEANAAQMAFRWVITAAFFLSWHRENRRTNAELAR
jgi:hypothetical protein